MLAPAARRAGAPRAAPASAARPRRAPRKCARAAAGPRPGAAAAAAAAARAAAGHVAGGGGGGREILPRPQAVVGPAEQRSSADDAADSDGAGAGSGYDSDSGFEDAMGLPKPLQKKVKVRKDVAAGAGGDGSSGVDAGMGVKFTNSSSGAATLIKAATPSVEPTLLTKLTAILTRNGLEIMEADMTQSAGATRCSLTVTTLGDNRALPESRWSDLRRQLEVALLPSPRPVDCQVRLRHVSHNGAPAVEVRVTATNTPALLAKIANVFAQNGCDILEANVRTEDDGRAVDTFVVRGLPGGAEEQWLGLQEQIQEAAMPSNANTSGRMPRRARQPLDGGVTNHDHHGHGVTGAGTAHASAAGQPPSGWMVLCFTDIQDSTKLWEDAHDFMQEAIGVHDWVTRSCIARFNGYEVKGGGDGFFIAFAEPQDAVRFSLTLQEELLQAAWPDGVDDRKSTATRYSSSGKLLWRGPRVRVGLHIGNPLSNMVAQTKRMDYLGPDVNVASRICDKALGGEIVASECTTAALLCGLEAAARDEACVLDNKTGLDVLRGMTLADMGEQTLRGVSSPTRLTRILPASLSGREQELEETRQEQAGRDSPSALDLGPNDYTA